MDRLLGTTVAVFGICACCFARYIFSEFRQIAEEKKDRAQFTKHNALNLVIAVLFLLCIVLLVCVWHDILIRMCPRNIALGPLFSIKDLCS